MTLATIGRVWALARVQVGWDMPTAFLRCGAANDVLADCRPGRVSLVVTSPRYLDLIDYTAAARGEVGWRPPTREVLSAYVGEHLQTCGWLAEMTAPDAVVAIEVDNYRDVEARALVPLPDLWRQMLEATGFRLVEHITLVRPIALGHRSGHFKRTRGAPGYFYPDSVSSQLVIAMKGDPMARLRRLAAPAERIPLAWAERFLKNVWRLAPPPGVRRGHPVPMDAAIVRALITFYSRPGDVVLDPFAGSGTTGWEAAALDRVPWLIEREPPFADAIRQRFQAARIPVRRLRADRRTLVTGAALHLALGAPIEAAARRAYLTAAQGDITPRLQEIARIASDLAGVTFSPEVVALMMRAERAFYQGRPRAA